MGRRWVSEGYCSGIADGWADKEDHLSNQAAVMERGMKEGVEVGGRDIPV